MTLTKGQRLSCALLALALTTPFAGAGEVIADPVCCRQRTACYDPCCSPCRVGPVRRFFRRVFRPCCPPPCPPRSPVVVLQPAPPLAPVWVLPSAPPVGLERPIAPLPPAAPPPATIPGTGSRLRREGVLTPPVAPPPVRVDRMASWGENARGVRVTPVVPAAASRQGWLP